MEGTVRVDVIAEMRIFRDQELGLDGRRDFWVSGYGADPGAGSRRIKFKIHYYE